MRPLILCLERLERLLEILDRLEGEARIRDLERTYGIYHWEVEQAEELGWARIETRKPPTGRPSRVVVKVNKTPSAKLPPSRSSLGPYISFRHWRFAFNYCMGELGTGIFSFRRRAYVAYQKTYGMHLSKESASASASRLLRRGDVRAAIQWTFAYYNPEIPKTECFPHTEREVWTRLHELGNFRAKWAPYWISYSFK